jgi:DMSO/TMAO reductase YedYZ molybdopterin-dependent catalytic subunit
VLFDRAPKEQLLDLIISPDTRRSERIPPGQSPTNKWPVLDASGPPKIDLARWRLNLGGLIGSETAWAWEEFQQLPRVKVYADFHCVTRWSRLGNTWEGPLSEFLAEDALVAPHHDGEPRDPWTEERFGY